ncbi:acyl-CoA reductase [uncultured Imperialibacter sp.]|uniref:acyl-CoA reductase n=1 Tax=uncultured Imperialibacter sp. TaxID=1672639 RepID=UPI0030DCFA05|tara:strand:+ start:16841 stop:17851 length:1011 start_codon:yes stop_codon:yes gene_type:complete
MKLEERVNAISALGDYLKELNEAAKSDLFLRAANENPWFTKESLHLAWQGILNFLSKEKLTQWTSSYTFTNGKPKKVGLVMAGNIPMVGFHDLLSVIIAGHRALVKPSSQDSALIRFIIDSLNEIQPELGRQVAVVERLNDMEAVIATGSDNSSRYFEYYFSKVPNIIRKNRTSCAIISGEESLEDLLALGDDLFSYFGLGCRNVSKLYVPAGYALPTLLDAIQPFNQLLEHHKYRNNYDYHKSIMLVNGEPHLDSGFSLFRESTDLVSPVSVVYYECYEDEAALSQKLVANEEKIQAIASWRGQYPRSLPFGTLQKPELWDYADGVDTLKFLSGL